MAQVKVYVLPQGNIQVFIDDATDEEATTLTQQVYATLKAAGIPFDRIGEVEFHRNGGDHVHVIQEVQHEQHNS
jgi:hypothetical protein